MKLSQATGYFGYEVIEGWSGTAWVELSDLRFNLHAFDRFLGPRSFGQKQRILFGGPGQIIPDAYELIRLGNGEVYLILSHNQDLMQGEAYDTSYVIQKAPYTASLIQMVKTPAPSGIGGTLVPTVTGTTMCDLERYTSGDSEELPTVRYATFSILMPASTNLDTDFTLEINGDGYEIIEIDPLLEVLDVRAVKRGVNG